MGDMTARDVAACEEPPKKKSSIRLRKLKIKFEKVVVREEATPYIAKMASEPVTTPQRFYELFKDLENEPREHLICVYLDNGDRIIGFDEVSIGNEREALVTPRQVFGPAMMVGASSIVLIHNHPGGRLMPSKADVEATNRLKSCGEELAGIELIDHIVICDQGFFSFKTYIF